MKLKLFCVVATLLLASSLSYAAPAPKAPAEKIIAKVNGVSVPESFSELLINEQVAQGAPNNDELRKAVKDELIRRELLLQEGKKMGLDKRADVVSRVDISRQGVIIAAYLVEWSKSHPISDAQIRAEYDRRVAEMGSTEYKTRHIQADKLEDAQAIIAKLQGGAKFADLAKDSKDSGSADRGGDIGWISPKAMPPAFAEAMTKQEVGKYSTVPVQTQYGYHIVMVDETRKAVPPSFEEKKESLRQYLSQKALTAYVDDLLKKAKVE